MVKSVEQVREKMKDRIATAGKYLRSGMTGAEDPIDVLLRDPDAFAKKLMDGVAEAVRRGSYGVGLKTAKERNAWRTAIDRAGTHFEERADDMVNHALEGYEERVKCIEEAKKAIAGMPSATRAQRIARSAKYQETMGACMDRVKGRK